MWLSALDVPIRLLLRAHEKRRPDLYAQNLRAKNEAVAAAVRGSEEEVDKLAASLSESGMLLRTVHARICGTDDPAEVEREIQSLLAEYGSLLLPGASQPKKLSRLVAELKRQALVKDLQLSSLLLQHSLYPSSVSGHHPFWARKSAL